MKNPSRDLFNLPFLPWAASLARSAFDAGLAVTGPHGSKLPIPVCALPEVRSAQEIKHFARDAALLSSSAVKMANAVLASDHAQALLSSLSPFEASLAQGAYRNLERLATTRVDFFLSHGAHALEVNATIPAMQGYSDIAADSFIKSVGRYAGLGESTVQQLCRDNGSNSKALHAALLQGFRSERGESMPQRIGLLCRRNDPQISELAFLAGQFRDFGTDAEVIHPENLSGEHKVVSGGKTFDLIYRHLFVRRIEETPAPYLKSLLREGPLHPSKVVILNPPASQVEVKTTLALLSETVDGARTGLGAILSEDEREVISRTVPWTRRFLAPPAEILSQVSSAPTQFVLKRAWDYGGKTVFIGRLDQSAAFRERTVAVFGEALGWRELCARASIDRRGGGFVVQKYVDLQPRPQRVCTAQGVEDVVWYVDYSAYASVGLEHSEPWGGVCRGSSSPIVNLMGGGGLIPLITEEVARVLLQAVAHKQAGANRAPVG